MKKMEEAINDYLERHEMGIEVRPYSEMLDDAGSLATFQEIKLINDGNGFAFTFPMPWRPTTPAPLAAVVRYLWQLKHQNKNIPDEDIPKSALCALEAMARAEMSLEIIEALYGLIDHSKMPQSFAWERIGIPERKGDWERHLLAVLQQCPEGGVTTDLVMLKYRRAWKDASWRGSLPREWKDKRILEVTWLCACGAERTGFIPEDWVDHRKVLFVRLRENVLHPLWDRNKPDGGYIPIPNGQEAAWTPQVNQNTLTNDGVLNAHS